MHLPFWLTTALLLPILIYQGKQARHTTPRLPEAGGPVCGQYGEGSPAKRVLVIGESTAAGVGITTHDQGLASQIARQVHQRTGQTIAWHTFGVNGIQLGTLVQRLEEIELPRSELVLLSMGVNDTTGLTPRSRFQRQLTELSALLASRHAGPLNLISVPPMHQFSALPIPLRYIMGWRARQLDSIYRRLAEENRNTFRYLGYPTITDPDLLARDGYHPSRKGYRIIAEALSSTFL